MYGKHSIFAYKLVTRENGIPCSITLCRLKFWGVYKQPVVVATVLRYRHQNEVQRVSRSSGAVSHFIQCVLCAAYHFIILQGCKDSTWIRSVVQSMSRRICIYKTKV